MAALPAALPAALTTTYLDLGLVEQVVAMSDPLTRNVAITHGYHELSEAVASIVGRDHANWLTFGQWASAEARRAIDEESERSASTRGPSRTKTTRAGCSPTC
jgi:hypothetical protein